MVGFDRLAAAVVLALGLAGSCGELVIGPIDETRNDHGKERPPCERPPQGRVSQRFPEVVVDDWGEPVKLSAPINTDCLEDAVEISGCGTKLYFMYAEDLLSKLRGAMLSFPNGTYVATRTGGPGEFSPPTFFELGRGTDGSLDGSPSFSPDGSRVYFHSNRVTNLGYQQGLDDFLDLYAAPLENGVPGVAENLGPPVNSVYADGEAALHPDGVTLYFASLRPGPSLFTGEAGRGNLWRSTWNGSEWGEPEFLPDSINRPWSGQKQPAFTADGNTLYFVSDHLPNRAAIYRSALDGDGGFSDPELVIKGIVGEPSLTADGRFLYFVHVLKDRTGGFGSDIWYVERRD